MLFPVLNAAFALIVDFRLCSARSGHRMAMWKNYLVLFGGFIDTGARTTYLDDCESLFWHCIAQCTEAPRRVLSAFFRAVWIFDTSEYKWKEIKQNDLRRPGCVISGELSEMSTGQIV